MNIQVRLTDGRVIDSDAEGNFQPFWSLGYPDVSPCSVCPLHAECCEEDPPRCVEFGMFEGFNGGEMNVLRSSGAIVTSQ